MCTRWMRMRGNKCRQYRISCSGVTWENAEAYAHYFQDTLTGTAIFSSHVYTQTHIWAWKSLRVLGWHALPTSCQKQFAAEFKSLLHLLGKSATAARPNQSLVTRLENGRAAKQVTSPPPALLHKHDPRAPNSPGHGELRELASV